MKLKLFAACVLILGGALTADAQLLLGTLTSAPQHAYFGGGGYDLSQHQGAFFGGFADKIGGTAASYLWAGGEIIPTVSRNAAGQVTLSFSEVPLAGAEQILAQFDRNTISLSAAAGAALPTTGSPSTNFSWVTGATWSFRVNKALNATPGGTNNYVAFKPTFTVVGGSRSATVAAINVLWIHATNGPNGATN